MEENESFRDIKTHKEEFAVPRSHGGTHIYKQGVETRFVARVFEFTNYVYVSIYHCLYMSIYH